jgi:nitrous oxide reductase
LIAKPERNPRSRRRFISRRALSAIAAIAADADSGTTENSNTKLAASVHESSLSREVVTRIYRKRFSLCRAGGAAAARASFLGGC